MRPGSPAQQAGLAPGDFIVAVDGQEVEGATDLANLIGLMPVGKQVALTVYRDGRALEIAATLGGTRPASLTVGRRVPQLSGAIFQEIGRDSPAYGRIGGVLIAEVAPGSPAWRYGLRPGDIVTEVNRQPVRSLEELDETLASVGRTIVLNLVRGNARLIVVIR